MKTIYEKKGYKNRKHYLKTLAIEHNILYKDVLELADILGDNEDFDGLVSTLDDYDKIFGGGRSDW